jgi:hypothetical protein
MAIWALMAGRTRVELTAVTAAQALAWAESVDGWGAADPKPQSSLWRASPPLRRLRCCLRMD